MKDLRNLEFISDGSKLVRDGDALKFSVEKIGKTENTVVFNAPISGEISGRLALEYSLLGFYRGLAYRAPVVYLTAEDGSITPLIAGDDLNTDNGRYKVFARVPKGSYKSISVSLAVDRAKLCEFSVYTLALLDESELPAALSDFSEKKRENITAIDITDMYNGRFDSAENDVMIGGGRAFESDLISPFGIDFKVKADGNNAVIPTPPPAENEDIISNFGVMAKRKICRPISRDSKTEIKIGRKISELYFILGMSGERYQRYTFATKGNILGVYAKEVTMPLSVDDVEGFFVEIVYADGRRDKALPKNLTENRFSVSGDLSVYAVAADFCEVESVVFHNKKLDTDFSLLAVSVNEGKTGYYPELLIPEYAEKNAVKVTDEKFIRLEDKTLTVRNGALFAELDLSDTLSVKKLAVDFAPGMSASSASLVKFRYLSSDELLSPCVRDVNVNEKEAVITLEMGAFSFLVGISIEEENNLLTFVKVNNDSQKDEKIAIFYPCLDKITSKNRDDLYYFVPKYQNVNSNESIVVCEESSPSFPMQFMSLYSGEERGGIGLLTRERETVVRIYHLEKRDGTASMSVEYPDMYTDIKAGESFESSPSVILASEDGYRGAMRSYKAWLDSWYVPYKCQNKQWYRECFWLLAEITDFFETTAMAKFPIWHDLSEKPKFNFLNILEEQKKISGTYPDILHMWQWTNSYDEQGKKHVKWGNYGGEDYDIYGGLAPFRAALDEFQEKTGVYASIYMHPTLFASEYPDFKKFEHLKVVNEQGNNIRLASSYRMCHANKDWRQYVIDKYPRVYSELGVPILYVDEFSLRIENRCIGEGHGHELPSNLLKTDHEFITALKDTVPEELVLYGEYAAVDMNARYIDCNITYGILDSITDMIERSWRSCDSRDNLSRVMTDAYRFAFPKIVQLVLPMALRNLSWHPHKFIFWNGEAEYDSFWDLLESDGNEFTCKAFGIKKKYADCFSSDDPEMMIESLSPAMCVNKFPGKDRTVYTVYNRAYRTFRGEALSVPHSEGNVYYDVWNERELTVKIENGYAKISLEVDAQSIGCILVFSKKN